MYIVNAPKIHFKQMWSDGLYHFLRSECILVRCYTSVNIFISLKPHLNPYQYFMFALTCGWWYRPLPEFEENSKAFMLKLSHNDTQNNQVWIWEYDTGILVDLLTAAWKYVSNSSSDFFFPSNKNLLFCHAESKATHVIWWCYVIWFCFLLCN